MKHLGNITNPEDVVTKKYVDDKAITGVSLTASTLTISLGDGSKTASVPTFNQNTTGNAATATKLSTGRTLWGQQFDGSANITGAIQNTGNITPSANNTYSIGSSTSRYKSLNATGLYLYDNVTYNNESHLVDFDLYLGPLKSTTDTIKGWKIYSYESYYYPLVLGNAYPTSGGLFFTGSKGYSGTTYSYYWGINTNDPLYQLHVNGTFGVEGIATFLSQIKLGGNTYYIGVSGNATKLAALTATSITATGVMSAASTEDYSVTEGIVSAALKVNGGAHIAKKLHVGSSTYIDSTLSVSGAAEIGSSLSVVGNMGLGTAADSNNRLSVIGNTSLSGVLNITGVNSYAQGIRIHHFGGFSSIFFGAANDTGLDAGMWGLTLDSNGFSVRGMASTTATELKNYVKIAYGGSVGIGTTSPSYKLHVNGTIGTSNIFTLAGTRGSTQRICFGDTSHYIECDANGYFHFSHALYSDSWVASGGIGDTGGSGGGSNLNVVNYAAIQLGTATGVASQDMAYVPTAYALRQVYLTAESTRKNNYNLTDIFAQAQGSTIAASSMTPVINDIRDGKGVFYVVVQKTINGTSYNVRVSVNIATTTGNSVGFYYVKTGSNPPLTVEFMEIGYQSGWKVLTRTSKAIN